MVARPLSGPAYMNRMQKRRVVKTEDDPRKIATKADAIGPKGLTHADIAAGRHAAYRGTSFA